MLRPIANPPHRFDATVVVHERGEWDEPAALAKLTVFEDDTRNILSKNTSPDLWHRWSINPYRGCMHACSYCYARSTHPYLGFGAGTDHDTKILVKPRAPELLEAAFESPSWSGEVVLFSGNTDCYQPLEHRWRLTRRCLEVCLRYRNPVSVITKAALIERDVDVLSALAREVRLHVTFSIPFLDPETCRQVEPGTPSPERRFRAMAALSAAGIRVGVNIAPVIPGLNDRDIPGILKEAHAAGARHAGMMLVRLAPDVRPVFEERLRATLPGRADGVLARLSRAREGNIEEGRFGERMKGHGEEWAATERLFEIWTEKLGYQSWREEKHETTFRRPGKAGDQLKLFG